MTNRSAGMKSRHVTAFDDITESIYPAAPIQALQELWFKEYVEQETYVKVWRKLVMKGRNYNRINNTGVSIHRDESDRERDDCCYVRSCYESP